MPSISPSARPPTSPQALEVRVSIIEAEIAIEADPSRQAAMNYELGCLVEHGLGQTNRAVQAYLQAYNLAPEFRPPLVALIRIYERRPSKRNLAQLLESKPLKTLHKPSKSGPVRSSTMRCCLKTSSPILNRQPTH